MVEYLLLFAFMTLISVNLVKALTNTMGDTSGSLTYVLSQHLTSGVCDQGCFFTGFANQ